MRDRLVRTLLAACIVGALVTTSAFGSAEASASKSPELCVGFVIDRSGSMESNKMENAVEGVIAGLALLDATDEAFVITFDDRPQTNMALRPVGVLAEWEDVVRRIQPAGGTDIEPALEAAVSELGGCTARRRHLVLLSDGQAPFGTIDDRVAAAHDEGIVVSTIALGDSADTILLAMLAKLGGGRTYVVNDPTTLRATFESEIVLVKKGP